MSAHAAQQQNGQQFNIVDQVIAAQTINALQAAFSNNTGFSIASLMSLLIVIFMDAIKKLVIKAVEQMLQHIEANKVNIFKSFLAYLDITRYFAKLKGKKKKTRSGSSKECVDDNGDIKVVNTSRMSFDPTLTFWNALYQQYKEGETGIDININPNSSVQQLNNNAYKTVENWNNVVITSPTMTALIGEQLKVTFGIENDARTITDVQWSSSSVVITDDTVIKSFIDFVPFPKFRKAFRARFNPFLQKVVQVKGGVDKVNSSHVISPLTGRSVYESSQVEYLFTHIISEFEEYNYDVFQGNYSVFKCANELYWLTSLVSVANLKTSTGTSTSFHSAWKKAKKRTFLGVPIKETEDYPVAHEGIYTTFLAYMPDVQLVADWLANQLVGGEVSRDNLGVSIKLFSDTLTPTDMQGEWLNFVKSIQHTSSLHTSQQKTTYGIFTLRVEETETTLYRDNPYFEQWNERRDELKAMMKDPNCSKDMCAELAKNFATMNNDPQTKQIAYQKVSRSVIKEHINDTKKEFGTLYLRKQDKATLENCMFQFKDKKELLKELGIPNKLGIMLYGLPGTGKTSTINAIATYLQKNLYYVNMNAVKTNADLKMLFDYVNKNCIDGGIIIMEDIDAMTKVVHSRQPLESEEQQRSLSNAEVLDTKDSELTLEFFLNILQGSLTADGSIFICTTNHIEKLDPAFCRDGRFDVKIEMKPADRHQFQEMYTKYFRQRIPEDLLLRIREYKYVPATVLTRFARYIHQNETPEEILSPFLE
jgi:DNA replication protein DnaC